MLNILVFDEKYSTLQGLGTPVDLRGWYDSHTQVTHMAFVCGQNEEVVLIDDALRARIYSMTTQQFR